MRRREIFVLRERIAVSFDRFFEVVLSSMSEAQTVMSLRVWPFSIVNRAAIRFDCALDLALGVVSSAEPEIRFRKIFRLLDGFSLRAD